MAKKHLTKKQMKELEDLIREERQRISESHQPASEREMNREREADEVDMAANDYASAQELRMRNREIFYAKKLDKALQRIESNEYGYCQECGEDIKFQRLQARPTAELCITCKEESERMEQGNFHQRKSKSLGETVQLSEAR